MEQLGSKDQRVSNIFCAFVEDLEWKSGRIDERNVNCKFVWSQIKGKVENLGQTEAQTSQNWLRNFQTTEISCFLFGFTSVAKLSERRSFFFHFENSKISI